MSCGSQGLFWLVGFMQGLGFRNIALSIKITQKPCIIGSLGPKALKHESFEVKGRVLGSVRPRELPTPQNPSISPATLEVESNQNPMGPCTQIVFTLAPKYLYRDYFEPNVYSI